MGTIFCPLLWNRSFVSKKWKIISTKNFLLYDLIHIHIESLLYLQKHTCQKLSPCLMNREENKNCFLKIGRNAYKQGETRNISKFIINPHWPSSWVCNMLQIKEHGQKCTTYLFQNDVVSYFESYWKRENVADISF